jgi:hypothetical protein
MHDLDRRAVLSASALAVGAALVGAPTAAAADDPEPPELPGPNPPIPTVPGMKGDPRANEFWYRLDQYTYFNRPPALTELYARISEKVGPVPAWRRLWLEHVQRPDYRRSYAALWAPVRDDLAELSRIQLCFFDAYYRRRLVPLVPAFAQMAQGLLYDPRLPDGYKLHTMDPPSGGTEAYHRWHAIIRAQVLLNIEPAWWSALDRLVGYAWAAQSLAQPVKDSPDNPGLPSQVDAQLKRSWLTRSTARLDRAFQSFPYPDDLPGA